MSRVPSPVAPAPRDGASGPLNGIRVVEIASEWTAFAGKMLGDLGADVVLVEPPGGSPLRAYEPFVDDISDPERSLWWWHYQTSKRGVVLDLDSAPGRTALLRLIGHSQIMLCGESNARVAELGIQATTLLEVRASLVVVSITPFGRATARTDDPATDLTLLAGGGPVWSCGYDDHDLPPVRGGGNQALHTAGLHAVSATLIATYHRIATGIGQHVDVNMHAAANVTTEAGSYTWLVSRQTVQRQTGRHAAVVQTRTVSAADVQGRPVNTGFPPRSTREMHAVVGWLDELGLRDEFPEIVLLELGIERGGITLADVAADPVAAEIFGAGRDALLLLARSLPAQEFFLQGQRRGIPVGAINAPEDVMLDDHFRERGFPVEVFHDDLGRTITYPGAPIAFEKSPWRISRRAPRLGEHDGEVLGPDPA